MQHLEIRPKDGIDINTMDGRWIPNQRLDIQPLIPESSTQDYRQPLPYPQSTPILNHQDVSARAVNRKSSCLGDFIEPLALLVLRDQRDLITREYDRLGFSAELRLL